MSHEITLRENGKSEMAFTGSRNEIWHGLGQELSTDASIDVWKREAGMDWAALESLVEYNALGETKIFPDRKLLFRSDTKAPLGIVGNDYKIVQPGEVLEFFDELTRLHGMTLSTAGTLFGGKRFWALADVGKTLTLSEGDEVQGHLLLVTSVDGTMSTQARFTSTRVVCNNTLSVALNGLSKKLVKFTHRREWDPQQVKIDMGLLDSSWAKYSEKLKSLWWAKMSETQVKDFYQKMSYDSSKSVEDQPLNNIRLYEMLMDRYNNGAGNELSKGTAWGALNGATDVFTHWKGNRDPSRQFWDSYVGDHANKKDMIFDNLVAMYA